MKVKFSDKKSLHLNYNCSLIALRCNSEGRDTVKVIF